jgi:hypothetical protein
LRCFYRFCIESVEDKFVATDKNCRSDQGTEELEAKREEEAGKGGGRRSRKRERGRKEQAMEIYSCHQKR